MATVFKRIGFESNVTAATATDSMRHVNGARTDIHLDTNRLFPLQSCKLESETTNNDIKASLNLIHKPMLYG